jgi:hypothetical protein
LSPDGEKRKPEHDRGGGGTVKNVVSRHNRSKGAVMAKKAVEQVATFNPIAYVHDLGIRSEHAYILGFASIGLSFVAWLISRAKKSDDKAQSDRWGIFVGHWAPTFFTIGLALKKEE